MRELNVVIIDDEPLILENLKYVLKQFENIHIRYESTDAVSALEYVKEAQDIQIIFVDITMPVLNGLDFAERVFEMNPNIRIVFVTAYEQYAINSFSVNVLDYILKPVTVSRVRKLLDKFERLEDTQPAGSRQQEAARDDEPVLKIAVTKNNRFFIIDPREAYVIMAQGKDIFLYTKADTYRMKYTINYWEKRLAGQGWIRCHRSILINIDHIRSISPMFNSTYTVYMEDRDEQIPVSRSYINQFKKALNL